MANRYDIIRIDFQASAKGANTAIESIRQEAEQCNNKITELKKNIAEAPKNGVDAKIVEDWNAELKITEKRFKQFSTAYKELIKGMRALDEGVKMFNDGSLSQMNAAFQKQVNNAAKLAQSKLTTGTDEWRQMGALMQETEQNYARMQRDTDQLIESLQNGGTVFLKTIEDEKKGLQDLLQVLPYMGTEYRKAEEQLQFLVKTTDEMSIKEKQLKGEIVTTDDARRVSIQLTEKGAEAARQRAEAADKEIEKGKQEIATLEKEREEREKNARLSAQAAAEYRENQRMHEDEIERLDAEMRKEEELAKSKRNGLDALQRKAMKMKDDAETEKNTQKELDGVYDAAKEKVAKLREEVEKLRQGATGTPAKYTVAEAVKTGAEEAAGAVKKETEVTEENTAAKKEEVKAGEEVAETNKKEAETEETLKKKHEGLVEETRNLITERDKLTKERDGLVKTLEAEAAAAEKAANAFASLSKEEAEAMLKERQATITKGADGKFSYTNAENAQHFLIESMRQVNPANAKGDALSLDSAGVAKVRTMFKERFGLQSDDDAKEAIKGLLADGENSLIKMGVMNNAFARIDLNTSKVTAYSKIIKDLTEVTNGEVKAIEGESEAKKRLEQVDTRLLELDEKIDANDKASREIFQQRRAMMGSAASATETLTEKTDELSESKRKNVEATNAQIESIKKMSAEEAKAAKDAMNEVSTVGYKANKLDMSNPEEVQSWLISQMIKRGASVSQDGTLSVGGQNIDGILSSFKERYQVKGDNQKAKSLFKEIVQGKGGGGLLREGGVVDFSADTLMIKANTEAYQGRVAVLKELIKIANKASYEAAHSTETTERDTQAVNDAAEATKELTAIEKQELEVKRLKEAYDKSFAENEKMKEHLAGLRKKKTGLPSGMDAALERQSLENEIKDYDKNVRKPKGREVAKLKNQWQKAAQQLAQMQAEETTAENQNTEATERNTKAKDNKAKASEGAAKATGEETQKSAELLAKEKELKDAEEEEATAKKNAEDQQKKTTKAVNDATDAETKANDAEKKYTETMKGLNDERQKHVDGLKELNEANKDTIKTNEENQKLLEETNGKIREQGERIRAAEQIKAQAKTDGIEKTEQSIRLLKEENDRIDQNSFKWKRNTVTILHLQEALDEMKGKPALMMMEQRMKNIGALSASALEETRRFWDTMAAGAEKGSNELATAEANVKALVEEERKRSEEKASKVIGNMGNFSDKEISDAVRTFEQLRDAQTHGNEEWIKFNNLVQQGKQHLEELAKADALTKMEERMSNLTNLSDAALAETKKYWEALKAGAEKDSEDLTKAETNLTRIIDLEKERTRIENERKAQIVRSGGSLNMYSEAEITEAIKAAKELHSHMASADPEARKLADSIANAEAHIKQYGIEAARAAQRQEELDATMQKQFQTMMNGMRSGVMPSQAAVKSQMNYWQKLIDDPKTAAESLQFYRDQLTEVKKMYDAMVEVNGKTAFEWFRSGSDKDASGNQIKEMADKLKEYRGTLLKETNAEEIQKIDEYLQRVGASAKKAGEELMDFEKAKELALQAGDDVYGKNNPAFLASPEEIQAATKSIEKYREELFKTIKQKKDMGEATDDEEAELQELAKYLKDLKFEQDNFNMSREKMEALMKTPVNATSIDELRAAIKRADAELKRMEGSLGQNNVQYKAFADQVKNAKNMLKEMEGQAKASATAWEKAWSRLKTYVVMYMGFNAVWNKVTGTADDIMELSDKMGEVRKTTQLSAEAVGELSENLTKLDVRTPLTELMSISASAGQLGLKSVEDIQGFTEAANKLMIALPEMGKEAATEMMRVAIATGEVNKIRKQLEEGVIEGSSATAVAMEKIASTIDRLRASSASTAPEITDFVKRLGAVGAQSGISIDQVAALGSTISSLGMRVEMSATALSRMIPAIKNNAFAIANAIGVAPEALRSLFEAGRGMEAILMIFQHLKEQNANADTIESLLGIGNMKDVMKQLNQQGARAGIVFAGLSQNVDELRKQLVVANEAYEENVAITNEFNRMNDTAAARWERFKNRIEEMFVSDWAQRMLGGLIGGLNKVLDLLVGKSGLSAALYTIITLFGVLNLKIGAVVWSALAAGLTKIVDLFKNWRIALNLLIIKMKEMTAAQWTNVFLAIAAAVAMLIYKLQQLSERASIVANEMAKANEEILKQTGAVDKLFRSVSKTNVELENAKKRLDEVARAGNDATESENALKKASSDHAAAIRDINSKYGQYLGYMLSETSSAQQLAAARDLINKKLRETITLKQQEAALGSVEQEFGGKVNKKAASVEQIIQTFYGDNYDTAARVSTAVSEAAQKYAKNSKEYQKAVKKILADNKIQADVAESYMGTFEDYRKSIEDYQKQEETVNRRFEARTNINRKQTREAINKDLNSIIADWRDLVDQYRKAEGEEKEKLAAEVYKQQRAYVNAVANNAEYFEGDNRKAVYDKNIKNMQTYEKGLRSVAGEAIRTIDAMERAEGKITGLDLSNDGESGNNPWGGGHEGASTDWKNMTANQLVERRKQMKDFVNAIQTDTDVQSVLKEDAALRKAIEKGMSSDMRTVIEWYNTERLKIQDELHARHLTNTGDWMDPKKERGAKKQFRDEMDAYLHELDAYYTERKTRIEEAGTDEGLTEAEIRNRTLNNEMEWQQRRAELQKLYSRKQKEVTEEELNAIYHIIAERTGDSEKFVKAQIAKTNQFVDSIEKSGEKGAAIVHRWMSQVELDTERSYLKGQQALTKQMRAIEAIIDKERPFNGITKSLQESLSTMDVLTGEMRKEYNELMKQGKDMTDFNNRQAQEEMKRTAFLLGEAENAYSTTIDNVMDDMRQKGMTAWADWLSADPKLQEALMAQLRSTYDSIQDAIKKEASQLKKQAEIMWNNILMPDGKTTLKQQTDRVIAQLGLDEGRVKRANSLIGAGQASERVSDKLAIQQMKVQLAMQEHYYNLMKKQGQAHVDMLNAQAKAAKERGDEEEATRKTLDAQHAQMALNLATSKEETELAKQREDIIARTEESQNRLYTELKSWADLLTSSLQSVMEASHAGDAEYYNERAKMNLTGKGGPGAGTYIIIDNEGTEDAVAHYEYLDERQALERQHEIERENAQAEAWKKLWDELNMKFSEQITDWINSQLQNQAVYENTKALKDNTNAEKSQMEIISEQNGIIEYATDATRTNTDALGRLTEQLAQGISLKPATDGNTGGTTDIGTPAGTPVVPSTEQPITDGEQSMMLLPGVTQGAPYMLTDEQMELVQKQTDDLVQIQLDGIEKVEQARKASFGRTVKAEGDTDKQMANSSSSTFAKMTMAANLYGVAYQAMSNENLSATQKFEMIALQSVGNYAISSLTAFMAEAVARGAVDEATVLGKLWSQLGWAAAPVFAIFTGLLGAAMGAATSAVSKSKSQISQVTGSSVGAGRLSTGMLTYAEGNVNEFTDPSSLTPGRQYNVDGADGRTYRARYMGKDAKTHITNGPEFHLVGEKGREAIIDAHTTRDIRMNEPEIWRTIQTLSGGGRVRRSGSRMGRGVPAFADGNLEDFESLDSNGMTGGAMDLTAIQGSLDRNSAVQEALLERLNQPIYAQNILYGPDGLPNVIAKLQKEAAKHGEKYI